MSGTTQGGLGGAVSVGVGLGDVTGPAGATFGNVPIFADATGKILADSGIAMDDLRIKRMFFGGDYDGNLGDFRTQSVAGSGSQNFNFYVPLDYDSLISVCTCGWPQGTNAAAGYQLSSDYGAFGEAYNNHSESAVGLTVSVVNTILFSLDLSSVFSVLAAGDYCGVNVNHMGWGFTTRYLGVLLVYTV